MPINNTSLPCIKLIPHELRKGSCAYEAQERRSQYVTRDSLRHHTTKLSEPRRSERYGNVATVLRAKFVLGKSLSSIGI
jgi:hypothetical protein